MDPSLNSFFLLLENELRRHLHAFLAAQAQSGTVDVTGIASPDLRLMLQVLAKRWHSPQASSEHAAQQKHYKKKNLRLEGSPVIAANFLTILTVLHCFHHNSPTHWEVIEEGYKCALRLLRALHKSAGIDTSESVSQLQAQWEALDKQGDSAFDHTPKIVVEKITRGREGDPSSGGGLSTPRLVLRGLPSEATVNSVICALQAQDIDVAEPDVHLAHGGDEREASADEPFVVLKSVQDQQALLELGAVPIKKTQVRFVKPEETREVVLYLPKGLPAKVLAGAWENEFGHVLTDDQIAIGDEEGHVVSVRLTPEQYAEVEDKHIVLLCKQIKLRMVQHQVKLLLPSADMSTEAVRATVEGHLAEMGDHRLTELIRIDQLSWAIAHLSSHAAEEALLNAKHLRAVTATPPTPMPKPTARATDHAAPAAIITPTPGSRQWFPPGPTVGSAGSSCFLTPTSGAHSPKADQPPVAKPSAGASAPLPAEPRAEAEPTNGADDHAKQTEQLKELLMLHYLKKLRPLLDAIERQYSVAVTLLGKDNAGFVRISGRPPAARLNDAWLAIDALLVKAARRQATFKFQDPLVQRCFKRQLQRLFTFSPSTAIHVEPKPTGTGAVDSLTVLMMASDDKELEALYGEILRTRTRIVVAQSAALAAPGQLDPEQLGQRFGVFVALDPHARRLQVVGSGEAVKECLAHVDKLDGRKATPTTPSQPPVETESGKAVAPASQPSASPRKGSAEAKTLLLSPRPEAMGARELAALVRAELGVEPTFVAVRQGEAYLRYRPDRAPIAAARSIDRASPDLPIRVEPFQGEVPSWKLCLKANSAALAKLSPAQLEADTLTALRACAPPDMKPELELGLGKVNLWHKLVTVEIGTEACLRRLQQCLPSPTLIGRASVKLRDEAFDRTEQLADVGLAIYLAKRWVSALKPIEQAHGVSITPMWGHSCREPRLAYVRVGGRSPDAVERAWRSVEALLKAVVRKRYQFKGFPDALVRKCLKDKLKQLNESDGVAPAIWFDDQGAAAALVVHVLGDSQSEVDAQDPNRVRIMIGVDRSLKLPKAKSGRPTPCWADLAKSFDVVFDVDAAGGVGVAGYRNAVAKCVAHLAGLLGGGSGPAKASNSSSATTATTAAASAVTASGAPPSAPASPATAAEARPHVAQVEYALAEAGPVAKLQLSIVQAKYGVRVQLDPHLRVITVAGPDSSSVTRGVSHIKKFIKRGATMCSAAAVGSGSLQQVPTVATTTTVTVEPTSPKDEAPAATTDEVGLIELDQ